MCLTGLGLCGAVTHNYRGKVGLPSRCRSTGSKLAERVEEAFARDAEAGQGGQRHGGGEVRRVAVEGEREEFGVAGTGDGLYRVGDVALPVSTAGQDEGAEAVELDDGAFWEAPNSMFRDLEFCHATLIADFEVELRWTKQVRIESKRLAFATQAGNDPAKRPLQRIHPDSDGGVGEGASGEAQADLELGSRLPADAADVTVGGESVLNIREQPSPTTAVPAQTQAVPEQEEKPDDGEVKTECPPHWSSRGVRCVEGAIRCQKLAVESWGEMRD